MKKTGKIILCMSAALIMISSKVGAQEKSAAALVAALPCSKLSLEEMPLQSFTPNQRPFGIPLEQWNNQAFDALKRRVDVCYADRDRNDAFRASRQIAYYRQFAAPFLANINRDAERYEAQKSAMLSDIEAAQGHENLRVAAEKLDTVERRLEIVSLPPAARKEVMAAFDAARQDLSRRQEEAVEAAALDETVRAAEAEAQAQQLAAAQAKANAEKQRLAAEKAAADVQDRKRNHAARIQAEAEAKARIDAATRQAEAARLESAAAERAQLESAKSERAAVTENRGLAAEEKVAVTARQQAEYQLSEENKKAAQARENQQAEYLLYMGAEVIFRVCSEDFGEYDHELKAVEKKTGELGRGLIEKNILSEEKLSALRQEAGLATGRGLLMLQARKNRDPLGACEEAATMLKMAKN